VGQLERLLRALHGWLPLRPGGEFSLEANPDSLDDEKVRVLTEAGVTRISLGAQSFQAPLLRVLDRTHSPAEVPRAVERVKGCGLLVSLDLIFGVPGQTVGEWQADLARALALGTDHVSTYGLTYEKGTPLWKQRRRGLVRPLDEADELALYSAGIDTLVGAGFEHSEISNFARPGRQCRHNLVYWANEAYFGFGMGAARYVQGSRELNTRDLGAYVRLALTRESTTWQSEELGPEERAKETLAVQLRRAIGCQRGRFLLQTGFSLEEAAGRGLGPLVEQGLLVDDAAGVRLTRRGKYVADAVIERLL
jgi:oxygen-independent coproporphyrinogen-3 oxidase